MSPNFLLFSLLIIFVPCLSPSHAIDCRGFQSASPLPDQPAPNSNFRALKEPSHGIQAALGLQGEGTRLRLRGGMDVGQQQELETILDRLQRHDASPQERQHAQQIAMNLNNPVDFSEIDKTVLSQAGSDMNARKQLAVAKRLAQLQHLLDNSRSHTTQVIACNALTALITNHWDAKALPHIEIRNYALSFLFSQSTNPTAPVYVHRAMTRLLSRITKLGWLECEDHRQILTQLNRFFDASVEHYVMGLQCMYDLVEEMDLAAQTRRQMFVKRQFLLLSLRRIFQMSLNTLQKLQTQTVAEPGKAAALMDAALHLGVRTLSFDFVGQREDDGELLVIAIPMSWRADMGKTELVDLLFSLYGKSASPQATRALEFVMLYTSVPRTVYDSVQAHGEVSTRLLNGIREIFRSTSLTLLVVLTIFILNSLIFVFRVFNSNVQALWLRVHRSKRGLDEPESHHVFCRLLGSLRDVGSPGVTKRMRDFPGWMELAANFTKQSLHDVNLPANTMHYLLQFWARLVSSAQGGGVSDGNALLARLVALQKARRDDDDSDEAAERSQNDHELNQRVDEVMAAYLQGRLQSVTAAAEGRADDPLEDIEMVQQQLEILPRLAVNQYSKVGGRLVEIMDQHHKMYENALHVAGMEGQLRVLEGQLTWLVRVAAAMVGGHYQVERMQVEGSRLSPTTVVGTNLQDGDEMVDAEVSRRVLQLMMIVDQRHSVTSGMSRCDYRLELALLAFMDKLKVGLLYVDNAVEKEKQEDGSGVLPHFLQSLLGQRGKPSIPPEVYEGIFKRIGLGDNSNNYAAGPVVHINTGDHKEVLGLMMRKLRYNLEVWGDHPVVVKETLVLLATMVHGGQGEASTAKMLLTLDVTKALFQRHTAEYLAFLRYPFNARQRTTFYLTLTHLLALNADDVDASGAFEEFMQPVLATFAKVQAADLQTEDARMAVIGLARDLRGVACSCNRRLYPILFELLFPTYLPIFARALQVWAGNPEVSTAVLKFWLEITENKEGRVAFDAASPAGLLLFKELAANILAFARHALANPVPPGQDAYKVRYKGIGVCLACVAQTLDGGYVAFGAFTLYGDPAMEELLTVMVQLALTIPETELIAFPKVATAYFGFLEAVLRSGISLIVALETSVVVLLLRSLYHGLANALQINIHVLCARSIDRFAAFLFRNAHRNTALAQRMRAHLDQVPTLVGDLQLLLVKQILTDEHTDLGILSHPLLSLILANTPAFTAVSSNFVAKQRSEVQSTVADALGDVMQGVARNLEMENRKAFLRNVQTLRQRLKGIQELVVD